MRNALGLMLASVVAAVVIAGVWFWTSSPRADAAPPKPLPPAGRAAAGPRAKPAAKDDVEVTAALSKPAPRPRRSPLRTSRAAEVRLRQSRCARRQPHRRDRHHGRTGLRLPALQAVRLPDRQGGRADLRRRSVADHAGGAEGAGGRMHQGGVLPDRQARDLSSRNPQAGRRGRPHRRLPHLVACESRQQEDDGAAGQGRDREGL